MPVIDIHSHFVPIGLPDMAERHGDPRWPMLRTGGNGPEIWQHGRRYRAVDRGYFDLDRRVEALDQLGIDVQVLSPLPVMLPFWADAVQAREWCTAYNELLADAVDRHPGRFLAFGVVPLQEARMAVRGIQRSRELGLAGVEFGTWLGGRHRLADPERRDVFSAAGEARLPVLLHPNHPDTFGCDSVDAVELGVGVGCETARAMAEMHLAGTLHDQPELRMCLAHGGGAFLWLWPRFGFLAARSGAAAELPACVYVDTAGVVRRNLDYLGGLLAPDRFLFGSDMPATAVPRVRALLGELGTDAAAVAGSNAEAFLAG